MQLLLKKEINKKKSCKSGTAKTAAALKCRTTAARKDKVGKAFHVAVITTFSSLFPKVSLSTCPNDYNAALEFSNQSSGQQQHFQKSLFSVVWARGRNMMSLKMNTMQVTR